jgi:hypothetical protein
MTPVGSRNVGASRRAPGPSSDVVWVRRPGDVDLSVVGGFVFDGRDVADRGVDLGVPADAVSDLEPGFSRADDRTMQLNPRQVVGLWRADLLARAAALISGSCGPSSSRTIVSARRRFLFLLDAGADPQLVPGWFTGGCAGFAADRQEILIKDRSLGPSRM